MKTVEVVNQVAQMLAKEDLSEFLVSGVSVDIVQAKKDKQAIIDCLNSVLAELAVNYCKVIKSENLKSVNGKIYYKDFSQKILKVERVEDLSGKEIFYKKYPEFLAVESPSAIVYYSYLPSNVSLEEEIVVGSNKITKTLLSYGTIAEYYLNNGLFQEAVYFRDRFEKGLSNILKGKNYKIKGRAFV